MASSYLDTHSYTKAREDLVRSVILNLKALIIGGCTLTAGESTLTACNREIDEIAPFILGELYDVWPMAISHNSEADIMLKAS